MDLEVTKTVTLDVKIDGLSQDTAKMTAKEVELINRYQALLDSKNMLLAQIPGYDAELESIKKELDMIIKAK